ncbi:Hypothetical protein PHPALM_17167 [Phytophthora palmivora]|uniref:Reverse transcriptase RNase H-like domain-containing protein n=1 Tax=Phytophthora palmivora TaxID=4796 RepID=A0A2P4XMX5_9STRA|nr:Hypothetical protein PHPALM_17167 [Phytophthora palmivora]
MFADASQAHFGTEVTQIPPEDPLAFLSGSFVGSISRWSTIDKEAYAIVVSSKRLMYLLPLPLDFEFYGSPQPIIHFLSADGQQHSWTTPSGPVAAMGNASDGVPLRYRACSWIR